MIRPNRIFTVVPLLMLTLLVLACNIIQPAPGTVTDAPPQAGNIASPPALTAAPTLLPTPAVPADWVAFSSQTPPLSVYHPTDWSPTVIDDHQVELRPAAGYAWMEISLIDSTNPGPAGVAFSPGADTAPFMSSLLVALREDGTFDEPIQLPTRSGQSAWVITGHNDRFDDNAVIGVLVFPDHALLMIGHQGDTSEDWSGLKAAYEHIIQSVGG